MYLPEKIIIKNKKKLNLEDYKVLSLLYFPIVGHFAFNIFQIFYWLSQNNNNNSVYDLNFLLEFLNMDIDSFHKNKDKLEAIGLLETFQDKNHFQKKIYIINPPINGYDFFKDPVLSQFLLSIVGENIYFTLEKVMFVENDLDLTEYQNISKKFQDIFCFKKINLQEGIFNYRNYQNQNNNLENNFYNNFDFDFFIKILPERFQKPFLFEYRNINYLMKLSFVYGLSPEEMSLIYQKIFRQNSEQEPDLNKLRIFLKRRCLETNSKIKLIDSRNHKNETDEMIVYLKKADPYKIICNFVKDNNASINLQNIIFKLVEQNSDIEKGLFNALIMYICKIKEHEDFAFLSYNYFQTVLDSWLDQGIVTTDLAYNFLIERNNKKIKKSQRNYKIRPKWLEDIKKKDLSLNNEE
ncbi:MAG: replication initiation and membrane attachment protein [Candidatus Phytoplasma cynodontis]|uniref:hypothetical protein n=1 Tax='Cynodon dactylon' phytoplasma TaxID=295320 RepID=UPI001265D268|nr:hypothetical protein ['Cynodon dactylon' phytoplasma]KAB8121819.1 hypothetical protein F1741_01665 ['Cynodon dactylon' phytoplasma]WIA07714.1 MAG: replication initiation and membrane attachment protein [Candidatus Phytoplasma cynodontis]